MSLVLFGPARGGRVGFHGLGLLLALVLFAAQAPAADKNARPWLGVALQGGPAGGVLIDHVFRTSPAASAQLAEGDMLVSVDGMPLDEPAQLVTQVARKRPGMTLKLVYRRGGRERQVATVLAEHPGDEVLARLMHVGSRAPELVGVTAVQGNVTRLKDVAGEVVLVDFFASWCAVCRALTPTLADWHRRFAPRGLTVVGVGADEGDDAARTAKSWKIPFAVVSDVTRATRHAYRVDAIPAVFLVDRKGVIVDVMIGYDPKGREPFEKHIEKLLAEKR
jgi:peroxiredoxin